MTAKVIPLAERAASPDPESSSGTGPGLVSFDQIVDEYAAYIGTIALKILGTPSEVDDVVQDTFLAAYKGLNTLRDPSGLKAWLGKIAVNVAARRLRRRRMFAALGVDHGPPFVAPPACSAEDSALLRQIFSVLEELPAKLRVPWSLRYLQGERLEAVADLCNCSVSSVKRRIARAQEAVNAALGDEL